MPMSAPVAAATTTVTAATATTTTTTTTTTLRNTVGGTPVFGRRTDPVLRSTFS